MSPAKTQKEFLKINRNSGQARVGVYIVSFMDGDQHIVFIPSLNLTSYGDTLEEAKLMMRETTVDYLKELLQASEALVNAELGKYGWKRERHFKKRFNNDRPPVDRRSIIQTFGLPEETKIESDYLNA